MTPAARLAAAITLLDPILAGAPAEKQLTGWARANRYAGSGDRAAIRDLVFDALRCARSYGHLGGGTDGRALMIGAQRAAGHDPAALFTGVGYGAAELTQEERAYHAPDAPRAVALDCPDWLLPLFDAAHGADTDAILAALQQRAPVFLRVNLRRTDRETAIAALAQDGVRAAPHPLSPSALEVTQNARRLAQTAAYRDGLVELQDAASQALVDMLPLHNGARVLDYCAGGGGKSLAMAARADLQIDCFDADPARMRDLPVRATRAGQAEALTLTDSPQGPYDLVLCDAPCSGSGAWRRSPQAKWQLTAARLQELAQIQADILDQAAPLVAASGRLAYATCSLLEAENADAISGFLARNAGWRLESSRRLTPLDGGDGFFCALLTRG